MLTLYPLYRAVCQSLYWQLQRLAPRPGQQRWELLWLLNEFLRLGYMALFEDAPAESLSYGMRFAFGLQDLDQLVGVYGAHNGLWGNVGTKIFHRPVNDITAERLSSLLCEEEVEQVSIQRQGWQRGTITRQQPQRLRTKAQILGMDRWEAWVWAEECPHPFMVTKRRYRGL
jgi:type IV secretory pathway TraG/TraD family ATPase VirD4